MYFEGDRWRVWPMVNIVLTGGEGTMATMLGSHRLTRRAFLGVAAASAGAVAAATAGVGSTPCALTEASGQVNLGDGRKSNAWVYNGSLPGPTFRVAKGGTASFTLKNGLSKETITHWHGMIVDHK